MENRESESRFVGLDLRMGISVGKIRRRIHQISTRVTILAVLIKIQFESRSINPKDYSRILPMKKAGLPVVRSGGVR